MRAVFLLALATSIVGFLAMPSVADEQNKLPDKPVDKRIDNRRIKRFIRQLGSDKFKIRQAAQAKLKKIGADALPAIEAAMRASPDAETRFRLKRVIAAAGGLRAGEGMIGRITVNRKDVGVAFHYRHGRVFGPEQVHAMFHKKGQPLPSIRIVLQGRLHLAGKTKIKAWFAGGGVNRDVNTLYVGGKSLGSVGDDRKKSQVYELPLDAGTHQVTWELRAGTFRHNLLKFENPKTGKMLPLYYSKDDAKAVKLSEAKKVVHLTSKKRGWPIPSDW